MGNVAGSLTYDTKIDTDGFEKGVKGLSSSTVALGNIMADVVKQVANTVNDVIKTGVNYNAQIEQYQVALTTLTGSADEANRIINQIKEDAARTPFDVAGLTQANQLLISAGVDADQARTDVINLGNAISATGGGNEELSRMAVNLQQIKNVGKASALDIKQFAYAGIDVYGLLADYMGIAREEAADLDVTYEDLTGALAYASQEGGKYYGAMEAQSKTLNGQMSTLKDNFNTFAGEAAEPLFNFLKDSALPVLNDLLTGGEKTKKWINENKTPLALLAITIGTLTTAIIAYNIAQNAAAIATTLATVASAAFGSVMAFITSPITLVILAIGALIAIGYLLVKNWDKIKETAIKVFGYIKDFIKNIVENITNFCEEFKEFISGIVEDVANFFKKIPEKIKEVMSSIVEFFKELPYKLGYAIGEMIGHIINFANSVKEVFTVKIPEAINELKEWVSGLPERIKNFLTEIVENVKEWAINVYETASEWISKTVNSIVDFFKELPGKIWDKLTQIVDNLKTAITNMINTVKTEVPKFINTFVDFIKELPKKMLDIGKNIVEGIWNGIKNAKDWLANKIKSFANGIVDGIKDTLKIKSPSRVFRDKVGQWIPKGIAVGIEANTDSALNSLEELSEDMTDKMQDAVSLENGKYSYSGTTATVSQILSSNATFDGTINVVAEVQEGTLFEASQRITKEKNLQTGFGG